MTIRAYGRALTAQMASVSHRQHDRNQRAMGLIGHVYGKVVNVPAPAMPKHGAKFWGMGHDMLSYRLFFAFSESAAGAICLENALRSGAA